MSLCFASWGLGFDLREKAFLCHILALVLGLTFGRNSALY